MTESKRPKHEDARAITPGADPPPETDFEGNPIPDTAAATIASMLGSEPFMLAVARQRWNIHQHRTAKLARDRNGYDFAVDAGASVLALWCQDYGLDVPPYRFRDSNDLSSEPLPPSRIPPHRVNFNDAQWAEHQEVVRWAVS